MVFNHLCNPWDEQSKRPQHIYGGDFGKKNVSILWRGDQKMRYLALGFAVVGGTLKHLS